MLNIWLIQIGEPLLIRGDERKMRSNLLAEELAKRGHKVLLWVSAFDHNKKEWAVRSESELIKRNDISVTVLKGTGYKKNVSLARFIDHRVLAWKFKKQSEKEEKPDVIIASLPPHDLAYQSVQYARKNHIPFIVDIRDLWPDIFLDNLPNYLKAIGRLLLFRDFQMVKRTMRKADSLVAVSNAFLEWGLRNGKRNKSEYDRVFYLSYHRPDTRINIENVGKELKDILSALENIQVVTYIGTFSGFQDPSVITECAKRLGGSDIAFVFTGYGDLYERVKERFKAQRNVFFVGWLNKYEIDALLSQSSIGICPYSTDSEIFPNKACMYLSVGMPVVSSYQGDLRRMIESERIGGYFSPGDVDSLTDNILSLTSNQGVYEEISRNAKIIFESNFVEEEVYKRFAKHVERIADERGL